MVVDDPLLPPDHKDKRGAMSEEKQADTVSVEAHQRVTKERDEFKQKVQELETQLTANRKVSAAESFLRQKGIPEGELNSRMELISPHLAQMDVAQIEEQLSSDRFRLVVTGTPAPEGEGEAEGEEGEATPPASQAPPTPGFGGPSPAGDELPPGQKKLTRNSPEVRDIIQRNDRAALERLYKEGRIQEPVRNY